MASTTARSASSSGQAQGSGSASGSVGVDVYNPASYASASVSSEVVDDGTCGYYAPKRPGGCVEPRSCSDCLRKQGCMIYWDGTCTDQTKYDSHDDFHNDVLEAALPGALNTTNPFQLNMTQWFVFPSLSTTYCSADDAVCTQCRQERFWRTNDTADSRFCVGTGGCVCVFNCEFPVNPPRPQCSLTTYRPSTWPRIKTASYSTPLAIVLGVLFVFAVGAYSYCARKRALADRNRAAERRAAPPTAASSAHAKSASTTSTEVGGLDGSSRTPL